MRPDLAAAAFLALAAPALSAADLPDETGWTRRPAARVALEAQVAEGLPGRGVGRVLVRDGVPLRARGGEELSLGCTRRGGPGAVVDLATDPGGLTYLAAETGVYVLGPAVDVLDPLEPLDGLAFEAPTSVHVDDRRRLWWTDARGLGVLDLGGHWGRRFTASDLPAALTGARLLVGSGPDGTVLVAGDGDAWTYRPGSAARPEVSEVLLDGFPRDPGHAVEVVYPHGFELAARGRALGGPSFRFRVDEHHVWRELAPGQTVDRFSPGERTLDVIAVDRDLIRSEPVRLTIRSAYPPQLDERFVVAALGLVGGALLALFVVRELRTGRRRGWWFRAPISAALAVVLALQVLAGFYPHGKGWPFIGFNMYAQTYGEGQAIFEVVLVGLQPNGGQRVVPPQAIGVAIDSRWQVLGPLVDRGAEVAKSYLETYNAKHPKRPLVGLQVQARRHRLTADGAVAVAPQVLAHYREAVD